MGAEVRSSQRVQQLINRDDFPRPDAILEMGKVWKRSEVETWARERGRTVAEAAEGDRGED